MFMNEIEESQWCKSAGEEGRRGERYHRILQTLAEARAERDHMIGRASGALWKIRQNERTAEHYQVGLIDAAGRTIEIGKPMTYLDWKGRPGFYVAQWVPDEAHPDQGVWQDRGFYPTEEDAVAFAKTIAAK